MEPWHAPPGPRRTPPGRRPSRAASSTSSRSRARSRRHLMLAPILTDPAYIVGPGADRQIMLACLLDLVNALTAVGSAVAVFSVIRRQHEGLALGFVSTRAVRGGDDRDRHRAACSPSCRSGRPDRRPAPTTPRSSPSARASSACATGRSSSGPASCPGSTPSCSPPCSTAPGSSPAWIPAMGLVGAPLLITSTAGIILGLHELGSTYSVHRHRADLLLGALGRACG